MSLQSTSCGSFVVTLLRQIAELMDKIIEVEREANPEVEESVLNEIRSAGASATHMYVVSWDFCC